MKSLKKRKDKKNYEWKVKKREKDKRNCEWKVKKREKIREIMNEK